MIQITQDQIACKIHTDATSRSNIRAIVKRAQWVSSSPSAGDCESKWCNATAAVRYSGAVARVISFGDIIVTKYVKRMYALLND